MGFYMKYLKLFAILLLLSIMSVSAKEKKQEEKKEDKLNSSILNGLKFRNIGPAITSGRIGDIAVDPTDDNTIYIAVSCGNVWKTTNHGVTFTPIFDNYVSYSIACITIDPNNHNILWLGTGENNSQRSVGWGDGVYKSLDGGKSWKNVGLKTSEHIGKIIVNPKNSDIVYVAAQGPLWGPGGERGLYKTSDAGLTWECVLKISENTGVTDIAIDPRYPEIIYAATYQRRRHVWTMIDGGPESSIQKSTDGGKTWEKLAGGLPSGELGKIGLALSPANPDIIYATIEANQGKGGFYRSIDRGASWEKRNEWFSGSAQYYQELIADPLNPDKVYAMDTYARCSIDGGKTFKNLSIRNRHVDDHALWINPKNTDNLIIGGDGGLYECYDGGEKWNFYSNLPVTQFYRIQTDNAEPFYNVYGGTQDNSTWGGPSTTNNPGGILNDDWFQVVGGDGYEPQIDPTDPNIVYGQAQYGYLIRLDRKNGERVFIQPQPEKGEEIRWNWDTPLIISPHSNTRLYYAANRLYRSDDRGNTWKAVSPDITRQIDRDKLKVMDKIWSPEAVAKNASTSLYGNTIAISESPLKENLIYLGTDDGLVQITEDAGTNWTKIESFSGVPEMTYCSDVFASQLNENVVYATFNNHKNADFKPYVLKSEDKGRTWHSIAGNLPVNEPVWTIAEDFVNPNLLFIGTEFGAYFTVDGGIKWIKFKGGIPTISIRDIDIQKRECDLLLGSFGRGIMILDNYAPLRELSEELANKDFHLFNIKPAPIYLEDEGKARDSKGDDYFKAPNRTYGAIFTYYVKQAPKSLKDIRKEKETEYEKSNKTIEYPNFSDLRKEDLQKEPYLIFTITDNSGYVVRSLTAPFTEGVQRVAWDLKYPDANPINKETNPNKNSGMGVMPGKYNVTVSKSIDGIITELQTPTEFEVKLMNNFNLNSEQYNKLVEFQQKVTELERVFFAVNQSVGDNKEKLSAMKSSLLATKSDTKELIEKIEVIENELVEINRVINGDESISKRNANQAPSITDRMSFVIWGIWTMGTQATTTQKESFNIVKEEFKPVYNQVKEIIERIKIIETQMEKIKSPITPGRFPEWTE